MYSVLSADFLTVFGTSLSHSPAQKPWSGFPPTTGTSSSPSAFSSVDGSLSNFNVTTSSTCALDSSLSVVSLLSSISSQAPFFTL